MKLIFLFLEIMFLMSCRDNQNKMELKSKDPDEDVSIYPGLDDDSSSSSSVKSLSSQSTSNENFDCSQCASLDTKEGCQNSVSEEQDCFPCFKTADWCSKCNQQHFSGQFDSVCGNTSPATETTETTETTDCEGCTPLNSLEQCAKSYTETSKCYKCIDTPTWCSACTQFYGSAIPGCSQTTTQTNTSYTPQDYWNLQQWICVNCHNAVYEGAGVCSCLVGKALTAIKQGESGAKQFNACESGYDICQWGANGIGKPKSNAQIHQEKKSKCLEIKQQLNL